MLVLTHEEDHIFLSQGKYAYLSYLFKSTLTSYCTLNNAEIGDWELLCPVLYFEVGSFTHKHTHKHYVPLLTSCSGKNLIAVSVKILYIETFVEVAKTACVLTFCCSFYIYSHLVDKDVLLPNFILMQ